MDKLMCIKNIFVDNEIADGERRLRLSEHYAGRR